MPGKWTWLRENEFFTVTPLNGWALINAAKTIKEVVWWYVVILTFVGLTIYNVQQVTQFYLSNPTRFKLQMRSSTKELSMSNMTLEIVLHAHEFSTRLPLEFFISEPQSPRPEIWSDKLTPDANKRFRVLHDYLCTVNGDEFKYVSLDTAFAEMDKLAQRYNSEPIENFTRINKQSNYVDLTDGEILERWKREMKSAKDELYEYWMGVLSTPVQHQNRTQIKNQLTKLTDSVVSKRSKDAVSKLFLLNALKTGADPRSLITNKKKIGIKEFLEQIDVTPMNVLRDTITDLSDIIHIEMNPRGSVFLTDWTLFKGDRTTRTTKLGFKFTVKLPDQIRDLQLKIYTYVNMWRTHVIEVLKQLLKHDVVMQGFVENEPVDTELACDDSTLFSYIMLFEQQNWDHNYMLSFTEVISFENNEESILMSGQRRDASVTIAPSMVLKSTIDGCSQQTHETCMDGCLRKQSIDQCRCLPWMLVKSYEPVGGPVCRVPCPQTDIEDKCRQQCDKVVEHSCSMTLTHLHAADMRELGFSFHNFHMSSVRIHIPSSFIYVETTEEYELTKNGFLSLLGGSLEFWSAIDVLGLVHLIVFLLIKCVILLTKKKNTSTVESIKNIEQELDDISDEVERSGRQKTALSWFKQNRLYERTPLTGFGYIAASSGWIERVFWYGLIACFTGITAFNIFNAVSYFASSPTHIHFTPVISSPTKGIANTTIQLQLPMLAFSEQALNDIDLMNRLFDKKSWDELADIYMEVTDTTNTFGGLDSIAESEIFGKEMHFRSVVILKGWQVSLREDSWQDLITVDKTANETAVLSLSDKILQEKYQKGMQEGMDILDSHTSKRNKMSWYDVQVGTMAVVQAPLMRLFSNEFYKLILLQAVKTGITPRQQMQYMEVKDNSTLHGHLILDQLNLTVEELYNDAMRYLGSIFHFQLSTPSAKIVLTDLSFGQLKDEHTIMLEFDLMLPKALKELDLSLVTFVQGWLDELENWRLTLPQNNYDEYYLMARIVTADVAPFINWFFETMKVNLISDEMIESVLLIKDTFESRELQMTTKWEFKTETKGCQNMSYKICKQECILDATQSKCRCAPWNKKYLRPDTKLCDRPCLIDEEVCEKKCSGKPCRTEQIGMSRHKQHPIAKGKAHNALHYRIKMLQHIYMEIFEEYEQSTEAFLAQLGALLDFWLGFNVIAAVHFFFYLFKQFTKIKKTADSGKRLVQLQELEERLDHTAAKLHKRLMIMEKNAAKKSRFKWLYDNKFFKETTITGFGFISSSKSMLEICFWWLLIIIFCMITVANVTGAISDFLKRPSHASALLSSAAGTQSDNLSLTISLPIIEMHDAFPTTVVEDALGPFNGPVADYCACRFFVFAGTPEDVHQATRKLMFKEWIQSLPYTMPQNPIKSSRNWNNDTIQMWQHTFTAAKEKLLKFLNQNKHQKLPSNEAQKDAITQEFFSIVNAPLRNRKLSNTAPLLLDQMKTGKDAKETLMDLLKNSYEMNDHDWDQHQTSNQAVDAISGDVMQYLYNQVQKDISWQVYVQANDPNIQLYLKDWVGFKNSSGNTLLVGNKKSLELQQYKVHVSLPNLARSDIEIQVHSFYFTWLQMVYDTLYDFYGGLQKGVCWGLDIETMRQITLDSYRMAYKESIQVHMDGGNEVALEAFREHTIKLYPSGTFSSDTESCSSISLERCLGMCEMQATIDACGCEPWKSLHLVKADVPVCTSPCLDAQTEHCVSECEDKMRTPCKSTLYKMHALEFINDLDFTETMIPYTVRITKQHETHLRYEKVYVTLGSFIAQLSGLCDLWLGINLFSMVHALLYMSKAVVGALSSGKNKTAPSNTELGKQQLSARTEKLKKTIQLEIIRLKLQQKSTS